MVNQMVSLTQLNDVLDAKEPNTPMKEVPIEGTPVETIRTDDNKKFLMEVVDAKQIRPYPPNLVLAESFSVTQEVDVFYNGCWWEGVIRNVLHGQRYKVYIKGTNDELLFQHSDLRPRQDWIDGTWFIASQAPKVYAVKYHYKSKYMQAPKIYVYKYIYIYFYLV
ncbi:hypothetical protein DVH24_025032 [Malus domestica]|uniref:Agenet domain-containing protein n=1 Tax=Malus domestica TaxID=3750 RepID=A0A498JI06_MALDO|nr:hypothetical protein DVH24_025032 [Malus domestica]